MVMRPLNSNLVAPLIANLGKDLQYTVKKYGRKMFVYDANMRLALTSEDEMEVWRYLCFVQKTQAWPPFLRPLARLLVRFRRK